MTFCSNNSIFIVATRKAGELMSAKIGRPTSDTPKDFMLRVRMDKNILEKLDAVCKEKKLSRSEIVRLGIEEQYDNIKK